MGNGSKHVLCSSHVCDYDMCCMPGRDRYSSSAETKQILCTVACSSGLPPCEAAVMIAEKQNLFFSFSSQLHVDRDSIRLVCNVMIMLEDSVCTYLCRENQFRAQCPCLCVSVSS